MTYIDYTKEPKSDIAFVDMKSFYASVECVKRNFNPLTTSLCVMSRSDNSSGLILASSPTFKKVFNKSNLSRSRELPFDIKTRKFSYKKALEQGIKVTDTYVKYIEDWAARTVIAAPRMALYIEENLKIQEVFHNYAAPEDVYPYSIDENFVDLSASLNHFVPDKSISKKDKLDIVSAKIQKDIWKATGIFSTVGMSNSNPLLAKLCLDNEAKKTRTMRANWSYEDVEEKVWNINKLTDFWGIGKRTAKRLNKLGIYSIKDLANSNPDRLKKEFGIIGVQLWFHANGVDESKASIPYIPKQQGLGNSQVLPRDYTKQREIELVLSEMAEQVAIRVRRNSKRAGLVSIFVGYSYRENFQPISVQIKITPSSSTKILSAHVIKLFRTHYKGGAVRNIGVRYGDLVDDNYTPFTFFDDAEELDKLERLDKAIDQIRDSYGFLSVQKASYLSEGSRSKARSELIGGHCGGLDGLM